MVNVYNSFQVAREMVGRDREIAGAVAHASQNGNSPHHFRQPDAHPPYQRRQETLIARIVHSRSQDGEERYARRSQIPCDGLLTITTAKSRTVAVRLMSMAMTGFFMTFRRPRTHRPLSMLKYDPVGKYSRYLSGTFWNEADEMGMQSRRRCCSLRRSAVESKRESNQFCITTKSHENTKESNCAWRILEARRTGRLQMDGRTCKIWSKSMKKGAFKKNRWLEIPRRKGYGVSEQPTEITDLLFNVEPKHLWRGLGHGRDEKSIVHTEHM